MPPEGFLLRQGSQDFRIRGVIDTTAVRSREKPGNTKLSLARRGRFGHA